MMDLTRGAESSSPPKPDEMAIALAGLDAPPVPEPATATTGVRWLTGDKRFESHTLKFPFALGEVDYQTVTVRRLSAAEVRAYITKLQALPADAPSPRVPMFFVNDVAISDEAWDGMDDDDRFALGEISEAFLPVRFRP